MSALTDRGELKVAVVNDSGDQVGGTTPFRVEGPVAHDGVSTQKPVIFGGVANSSTPSSVASGDVAQAWQHPNGSRVITLPSITNGDNQTISVATVVSPGGNTAVVGTAAWRTNTNASGGTSRDMERNNVQGTAIAQTADSVATITGSDIPHYQDGPVRLIVTLTDKQGTVTFTPKIQIKTAAGVYVDYWTAAAALSANGTYVYEVGPAATSAANKVAGVTESVMGWIGKAYRVVMTYSGAGAGNSFDVLVEYDHNHA